VNPQKQKKKLKDLVKSQCEGTKLKRANFTKPKKQKAEKGKKKKKKNAKKALSKDGLSMTVANRPANESQREKPSR